MNIGQASNHSGVSAKMIRYYESIGLMPEAGRTQAGYRVYSERDVHLLRFVRRSRDLGFALEDIRMLLGLWQDDERPSAAVKDIAMKHIDELTRKIAELQAMKRSLQHLAEACHGDDRPDCPILDDLSGPIQTDGEDAACCAKK
ncbi:Cu(I)-responsive transcriptional regulator [Ferrovibrio terrae]|uniref:Cu(I)-responsive transcriptional regulator n=1 Tax=Ferrovibrio terrae TaxID=2594003 RepID=A0A516H055_9PROT|nr:Cu(I)-responsive transcriptional regulator [Ferrovibrio terrae]QDO96970.1 Cu(I)-responsive transcriptional regulator [Ferrovibrio terrae]